MNRFGFGIKSHLSMANYNPGYHSQLSASTMNSISPEFRVEDLPPTAYYIPDFLSQEREELIMRQIHRTPMVRWTQLKNRRLINFGGLPHRRGMIPEPLPSWLQAIVNEVNAIGHLPSESPANHVLLNEYTPGQGIMPHVDGNLFFPTITTLNLGSHAILKFYDPPSSEALDTSATHPRYRFGLLLQPRSMLVLKDELYHDFFHGIDESKEDSVDNNVRNLIRAGVEVGDKVKRNTRVSLTIRNVPRTSKAKILLGHR